MPREGKEDSACDGICAANAVMQYTSMRMEASTAAALENKRKMEIAVPEQGSAAAAGAGAASGLGKRRALENGKEADCSALLLEQAAGQLESEHAHCWNARTLIDGGGVFVVHHPAFDKPLTSWSRAFTDMDVMQRYVNDMTVSSSTNEIRFSHAGDDDNKDGSVHWLLHRINTRVQITLKGPNYGIVMRISQFGVVWDQREVASKVKVQSLWYGGEIWPPGALIPIVFKSQMGWVEPIGALPPVSVQCPFHYNFPNAFPVTGQVYVLPYSERHGQIFVVMERANLNQALAADGQRHCTDVLCRVVFPMVRTEHLYHRELSPRDLETIMAMDAQERYDCYGEQHVFLRYSDYCMDNLDILPQFMIFENINDDADFPKMLQPACQFEEEHGLEFDNSSLPDLSWKVGAWVPVKMVKKPCPLHMGQILSAHLYKKPNAVDWWLCHMIAFPWGVELVPESALPNRFRARTMSVETVKSSLGAWEKAMQEK